MNDMGLFHDAAILARHYWAERGLSSSTPDRCACGTRTVPLAGNEDMTDRRAQAFAEHQARMLARAREDAR